MTLDPVIILSAIVLVFAVFALTLAWGERRTRRLEDTTT